MQLFRIANRSGAYVELLDYGATLVSLVVPDRHGVMENVVLRYPNLHDYLADTCCVGSTVGRFANRIAGAKFSLDGKTFYLDKNDGDNSNHGGFAGFSKKHFDHEARGNSLLFSARSVDGEGGFPGNIELRVAYTFTDSNDLHIAYQLVSDKTTVANITNHAYFNLDGSAQPCLPTHELQVNARLCLEFDERFLPTGKILPVANTAFDFSTFKNVGQMMQRKQERHIQGYNAYFLDTPKTDECVATLRSSASGRALRVHSTMPGLQFYTGDYLCPPFKPFAGFAMEAQFPPDAPNHPHFPSCVVEAGREWRQEICYCLGCDA
jgi:aldose 1-epimerase